jgi:macrolide-specific efflux system membrane fusion protein
MTMVRKIFIAGILLAVVGAGVWVVRAKRREALPKRMFTTVTVTEGPIEETVDATGTISPLNRVEIKPPISGRIERLLADEGNSVREGQILAWMSSDDRAAVLDAARAQGPDALKRWEEDYKATPIVAPLSGTLILRDVVVGQTVNSASVLFAMSDRLIVLAQVDESDIGRVHREMPVRITLDAYPDVTVDGKVFEILYEGKNVSNVITYGVKVRPVKVPPFFRSQMTANVNFVIRRNPRAILLAASAVQIKPNGSKQVSVPGPEGKPEAKEITTGIESGDQVEILTGLAPGDSVLLTRGKYVPQQGPQSSPLTMGGSSSKKGNGGGSGSQPRSK